MSLPTIRLWFRSEWLQEISKKKGWGSNSVFHMGFKSYDLQFGHNNISFDWTLTEAQLGVVERYTIRHVVKPVSGAIFPNLGVLAPMDGVESAIVSAIHDASREINISGTSLHAVREMYFHILGGGKYRTSWSTNPPQRTRFFEDTPEGPKFLYEAPYHHEPLPMSQLRIPGHEDPFVVQVNGRGYTYSDNSVTIDILVKPLNQLAR